MRSVIGLVTLGCVGCSGAAAPVTADRWALDADLRKLRAASFAGRSYHPSAGSTRDFTMYAVSS
jgi:hypothetical protein